jgi:hypothetical protein
MTLIRSMTMFVLLFGTALSAAEPPAADATAAAMPAVDASSPDAQAQTGRGNPRRQPLPSGNEQAQPRPPRPAAAASDTSAPANARGVADRIELEATRITGNAELPRVMYVVPWRRSELGELGGRPAKSLLDEVLEPVDRDVFRRQNRYYEALRPDGTQGGQ